MMDWFMLSAVVTWLVENQLPTVSQANASEVFAAELDRGIYVRSGEAIPIREAYYTDDDGDNDSIPRGGGTTGEACHVVSGGGFAVLQECSPGTGGSNIIIEKVGKPRFLRNKVTCASSRLIKCGDTDIFKLVYKGRQDETRYLTIHRGWWLKWVSMYPQKNGFLPFILTKLSMPFAVRPRKLSQLILS
jgi:hypothetical protein